MKRTASPAYNTTPVRYRNVAPSSTGQNTKAAGGGHAGNGATTEESGHTVDMEHAQDASLPFPGPFAHDLLPEVVVRFGQPHGLPPLALAGKLGNPVRLGLLSEEPGDDISEVNSRFACAALRLAAQAGDTDTVEFLLASGVDVNVGSRTDGRTALIDASCEGKLGVVNALLKHPGILVDQCDSKNSNALSIALSKAHIDITRRLIDAGADVNLRMCARGRTALMYASAVGNMELLNAMLGHPDTRIDDCDSDGLSALAWASKKGHVNIVERLNDAGANMALLDMAGRSNMHHAIENGHAGVVERLLNHGIALPDPLAKPAADAGYPHCLSDLYLDQRMPAASADNPLRLLDPSLFDDHGRFFQALVAALSHDAGADVAAALADWLAAQGIRHTVIAPVTSSLGHFFHVPKTPAAPGQRSLTAQQMLAHCACAMSKLLALAPDRQVAAHYVQAGLSAAGAARLSQIAVAQRDKLVALANAMRAELAGDMLGRLVPECLAHTGAYLHVDVDGLRASMVIAGFVAPLAEMLVDSWRAALGQQASAVAMLSLYSVTEMNGALRHDTATESAMLLRREILRRLDSGNLLARLRAALGGTGAEGVLALFDHQCRQLREYCTQRSGHG